MFIRGFVRLVKIFLRRAWHLQRLTVAGGGFWVLFHLACPGMTLKYQ
jgi:hypothetical protein